MIAPLGRLLILLSLLVAAAGATVAFAGGGGASAAARNWTRRFAYAYALLIAAANAVMVYALLAHDFSVSYVAHVGSRLAPTWVTIVSLWSSLEGSILFWGLVLGVYVALATRGLHRSHPEYMPHAAGVWLASGAFFSLLLSGPAQPFGTVLHPPADGPGANPLLQNHVLMAVHPPFLYAGYVGMTIPFGLASAALLAGRLGHDFLRPLRNWLLLPWAFLTVSIMLGGCWAYEVLGWGGYWAWDPVENASLLPWLTATAALHSAVLTERKGVLKGWTVTLVMASFLLTILGTFMTRSGVFNSVHSFTQSAIGPTMLVFLAAALLWSVALLALRIDTLAPEGRLDGPLSRDGMFLVNNLVFVLFTFTVLLGTVFPLLVEAIKGVQISVGRPYFDKTTVPIGLALLWLMGVGPALPWGRLTAEQRRRSLLWPLAGGVALALVGLAAGVRNPWVVLTLAAGGYAAQVALRELWVPWRLRMQAHGEGAGPAFVETHLRRGRRRLGAQMAHAGAIVAIVAIAVSSTMGASKEAQLQERESTEIGPFTVTFLRTEQRSQSHRDSMVALVEVKRGDRVLGTLSPAMHYYPNQREPIGSPDVLRFWTGDLYLSILNLGPGGRSVGLLAMVNPMVGWIWVATTAMGLGALVALIPARRGRESRDAGGAPAPDSAVRSK